MKIAIITQPLRYNIGGLLQNYALQQVLKKLGHNPITFDPDPYYHVSFLVIVKRIVLKLLGNNINVFIEYERNRIPHKIGKFSDRFIKKYISCFRYCNISQIKSSKCDVFMVGSDQVWRPRYNHNRLGNMFLDFTDGMDVKRIAYAASFGTDEWEYTEEQRNIYSVLLKRFDSISVREKSAVSICENYFKVNAVHVLDPTLLLTKDDYIQIIKGNNEPKSDGDLLVYFLDDTEDKNLLKEKVVKDYMLTPFNVNIPFNEKNLIPQISVSKWLRGFYDAKYVITDSFHACVFSIIFHKPFILYANLDRGFSRFKSLLETFNLTNCMVFNSGEYNGIPNIEYDKIDNVLYRYKKISFQFLRDSLI